MENKYKRVSIIFDMDGTLVDSAKIAIPAFEKICPEFGFPIPEDDTIISAIGYANPIFYYKIYPNVNKDKIKVFGRKVEQAEREIVKKLNGKMLFDGIVEMINNLADRNIKMYIASTGDLEHVDDCLKVSKLHSFFDEIHCNKPDKELMVANIIKNSPDNKWVMVGDRKKDSRAAKYNNIISVGAAYGYCVPEDYREFDYVINSPNNLMQLIDDIVLN